MADKGKKPIRVVSVPGKHRTERRVFPREIHETYCAQRGCRFRGKPAVQGVCHSSETFDGGSDWSYIDRAEKYGKLALEETRQLWLPGKVNNKRGGWRAYARYLESCHFTHWVGEVFHLDEMVRLRRRVSILESQLARARRRK